MKKLFILILGIIVALPAISQTTELVEVIRRWPNRVDVNVIHGLVHKRLISDQNDSAFYFHANGKQFIATTIFYEVGVPPVDPIIEIVDSGPTAGQSFVGAWFNGPAVGNYNGTISFASVTGNTTEYIFTGTKIELYVERHSTHGQLQVLIDDVIKAQMIDLYNTDQAQRFQQKVFESAVLPAGQHKITVKVLGSKNVASSGAYVVLDYYRVTK